MRIISCNSKSLQETDICIIRVIYFTHYPQFKNKKEAIKAFTINK